MKTTMIKLFNEDNMITFGRLRNACSKSAVGGLILTQARDVSQEFTIETSRTK